MTEDTFPKLLMRNYQRYGDREVAIRRKDFGIWKEYTWKDYYEAVKLFSLGLVSLGLEPGDKVAIIGDNAPEWFWAELAAQAAGGVALGIFQDSIASEVEYIIGHSDSKFVVVKDQEQVDKMLAIKDELPELRKVIYWDPKGLWGYEEPILLSFEQVVELGRGYEETRPGSFEQMIEKGKGNDVAVLCYTSGTTGVPKGVVLTSNSLLAGAEAWFEIEPWYETDEYLAFQPPAWIAEQVFGIASVLVSGAKLNFPEAAETVQENIREIGPQFLMYSSRLWESVVSAVQVGISEASSFKRFFYNLFLPVGYKMADFGFRGEKPSLFWRALYKLADLAVFRAIKDSLGLMKARTLWTGGATTSPDALRFLHALGIKVRQLYGLSEAAGIVSCHRADAVREETVGHPLPGLELRISDDGEILMTGGQMFQGYYKDPETTRERLVDGWVHTGDAGFVDQSGELIYLDRVEDLLELAGGGKFAPQYIESRLKFSPYVKDVMVVGGEDKAYVAAIINIDFDNVGKWAEDHRIAYTTFVDLSQREEVYGLIRKDVDRLNSFLPEVARVRKFVLLHKEFDPDEAELTRTRKLRRAFMEGRYQRLIGDMYSDKGESQVEAEVRYRDGRMGKIVTSLKISSLEGEAAR